MPSLCFIIPTVPARRARLDVFLEAAYRTMRGDTTLLIACDALPLSVKVNRWAVPAAMTYGAVGFLADDTVPETEGWDVLLADALPGIAYPYNRRRDDIPEHHLTTSAIIRAVGWLLYPGCQHYYTDNVLADLGHGAGCLRYVPGVLVRHDHWDSAPVEHDETYKLAEQVGPKDHEAYQWWRRNQMQADIAKVKWAL